MARLEIIKLDNASISFSKIGLAILDFADQILIQLAKRHLLGVFSHGFGGGEGI